MVVILALTLLSLILAGNCLVKSLTVPEDKQHVLCTEPPRSLDPRLEIFQMYKSALQVYKAAKGEERLPLDIKQYLNGNRRLKQKIYHLIFEVIHCKSFLFC